MGDPDKIDEAYKILEERELIVPPHLKNLFKKLSLVGLRVWANIKDSQFETFEDSIRGVLANENKCQAMSTEEKKTLFGEFWDNPKEFKFLPGEQEIMKQMRKISQKHLKKTSHKKTVRGRDSKYNESSSIPIIDIDIDIKEEVEIKPEISKLDENKATKNSNKTPSDDFDSWSSTSLHTAAVSLTQKSNNPSVELNAGKGGSTTNWIAASDALDSTTSTLIAAASQTEANAGTLSTDDWCEKTNSQTTNSNEKEASPCVSKSTNDWDACADAWVSSSSKTPRNEVKAITNVDQSSWGATCKLPASSNSKTPSDDWDSWSTTSNSTAPKSNIVPISDGNDDWSTSADAWGAFKGTNAGSNQSDGWGSTETVKSSWTSGYNASRDGRGSERKPLRLCFKCNEEGHMSYNCPTNPNRGRGGGRGSGRGGGTRVCFKCNEEGHMSYNCPTGPTRGRGGGRGGGSTRPCYKCNQEGHMSYNCPTASRGGVRSSPASGNGATNSSTSQPVFDDWGTLTATSGTISSNYDSDEKKDDWGSSSGTVSSPWANDSNAAAKRGRISPRSSAPFRNCQPVGDDCGISSNPFTVPIIKTVSHTTTSGSDYVGAAADACSTIDTTKSTLLPENSSAAKVGGDDCGSTANSSSSIDSTKFTQLSGNSNAAKVGGDCDALACLERICSPISPQSSRDSVKVEDAETAGRNRVGSVFSIISSGDDLPSESHAVPSPITSEEFRDNNNPSENQPQNSPSSSDENDEDMEGDDEDDFSSPEFEKLEINAPTSRTVTKDMEDTEIDASSSSHVKERSRSKSESHKSDRKEKLNKDRDRDRQKDREKRREREKREKSERRNKSHHSKSGHKDRDDRRKSSHRDKERDRHREKERDCNRSKSRHEADRYRSSSHQNRDRKLSGQTVDTKQKEQSISPLPTLHPKAYLWKRPDEKPKALRDYLARFPEDIFDEMCNTNTGLCDVSVSSVSSYEDSDAESFLLYASEVEVDSDVEKAVVHSGGRVSYRNNADIEETKGGVKSDFTLASDELTRSESCLRDQQLNINNNKRVRKLITRYSDSYVGSELRKIITTHNAIDQPQRSPRLNTNIKTLPKENQENCIQVSSSEEIKEREETIDYQPPDAKRLRTDQPLPSCPEKILLSSSISDECPSSGSARDPRIISRNRPCAILKIVNWGISAEVGKSVSVSYDRATPRIPLMEDSNVTGIGGKNYAHFSKCNHELIQSTLNPFVWNGTIIHGRRCVTITMKNMDVNPQPVPADFEMPKSMRVVGTIEPKKVWTYLKRVKQTTNESIGVFEFSPATTAEVDGYKFFFDELHGINWFAVIADAPDSKLPCCFKDFYVVPLAKDSLVPLELTSLVKKSFFEQRTSDLFLGVVVFRVRRFVDQSNLNPMVPEKTSVPDTQSKMESDSNKIQAANSSEPSQVASAHPPTRMPAIRQKLQ